jgi:hypothetical protein
MCKSPRVVVIVLMVAIGILVGCNREPKIDKEVDVAQEKLGGFLDNVKDSGVMGGFEVKDASASRLEVPRYILEERDGEQVRVYTPAVWIGNTFYSYQGGFSMTKPDGWVTMTSGQYNKLFDRTASTMHLGVVSGVDNPHTVLGMAKLGLRSSIVRIDNTHDRVAMQFEQDVEIGGYERPTFLTPVELGGEVWYYFRVVQGGSVKYFIGTCIDDTMYIMWVYYDEAYPITDILAMFGTLDKLGAHLSPSYIRKPKEDQIYVSIPEQLPDRMPLRILGLPPSQIPTDFQEEIKEGIRPDGLSIPNGEDFKTHIVLQVDGTWIWDLVASEVRTLSVAPYIKDGSTLVPIRIIAETLGAGVSWHGETQMVTLDINNRQGYDNSTISFILDVVDPEHSILGLDVPATRVGDTTFVPLRFVSEFLGAGVYWIGGEYRQIDIII